MQKTKVSIQTDDRSSIIAAFFLGIATTFFIIIYWILFQNILVFSFLSLATLIIFLTISILLAQPRNTKKIVHISKVEGLKKEENSEEKKSTLWPTQIRDSKKETLAKKSKKRTKTRKI